MKYIQKMFSFEGQVAIVAGGSGVIGQVMAHALAAAGAKVYIWGRSSTTVTAAVEAIRQDLDLLEHVAGGPADTASETEVVAAVAIVEQTLGTPTILINAVGGNRGKSAFIDLDTAQFEEILQLNLTAGLVIPSKALARYWIDRESTGCIINLASMSSYLPLSGVWAYDAAKAGVLNLTTALASELAPHRIRVNAIAPGFFLGKQNRDLLIDTQTGEYTPRGQAVIDHTPYGRFGDPEELAGATLFFASEQAAGFVTGVCIPVDGGYLSHSI